MFSIGNFEFLEAQSDPLKIATYRLRYKVYVEEFGFEKKEDHPFGIETDEFDPYSLHFAAIDEDRSVIGTTRLVFNSGRGLPIQHAVPGLSLTRLGCDPDGVAEISRLAVSKRFRRRPEDGLYGNGLYEPEHKAGKYFPFDEENDFKKKPVVVLGLYRLLYCACKRNDITHLFLVAEKRLLSCLRRYGLAFQPVGGPVDYHGIRIPCFGIIDEIEEVLSKENPALKSLLLNDLHRAGNSAYSAAAVG